MRAPLSWLRDFAPLEGDVGTLAETLSGLGLVVEGVEQVGEGLDGVVVARVLDVRAHPQADRVRIVDVDAGDGQALQIICGAANVAKDQLVPLATIGATLPGGFEIGRRKMRGEWSNGMICSETELAFGDESDGIMVLPDGVASPGTPLKEALGLSADVVFDLDVSANRPDAMSMVGVARDLAAKLGQPFTLPEPQPVAVGGDVGIVVESPELCPRFTGTILSGVTIGPSPDIIVRRLTMAGMRSINNVVDASNYVMLELGQPTHPYDIDRLPGKGLLVRAAQPGETLVTLDDVERRLGDGPTPDCLICDAEGTPVGVAGIMGGASSEISDGTDTVYLEAAWFTPMAIARTAKRLGLRTEASARFERGVDHLGIERAVARFCELLPGTKVTAGLRSVDSPDHVPAPGLVPVRTTRVNAILGTDLNDQQIAAYLEPIGFQVVESSPGVQKVAIPSWRPDSEREIDVIEEVARHHGYERIARSVPSGAHVGAGLNLYQRRRRLVRQILAGVGPSEAWTTTFLAPGDLERAGLSGEAVEVENPMVREESLLRTALLPGLLKAVALNASRQLTDISLFEIGHVFGMPTPSTEPLPDERERLAIITPDLEPVIDAWNTLLDGLHLDATLESAVVQGFHPTRSARIIFNGQPIGAIGEVDPDVIVNYGLSGRAGYLELDLEALLASPDDPIRMRPISRFPASDIDLAFVVPDTVPAAAVRQALATAAGPLLEDLRLFDVFQGGKLAADERSLAYRLRLRALDRTLTDAEVAEVRQRCIDAVEGTLGARLRT
jgi:phenylalanyl-tRNA synthetase beta chain